MNKTFQTIMERDQIETLNFSNKNEAATKEEEEDASSLINEKVTKKFKNNSIEDNSKMENEKRQIDNVSPLNSSISIEDNNNENSLSKSDINSDSEKEIETNVNLEQNKSLELHYKIQKEQIQQLKEEKKAVQTKLSNIEEFCQFLQTQKTSLQSKVKSLNNKNLQLQNEISKLKASSHSNNNSNDNDNSNDNNPTNNNNNAILAHFQKENQNLLDEYQQLSNKYLELKAQTRNQQHNNNSEIQKKQAEITKLQAELQEKDNEIDNMKKNNDRTIKKMQQEIGRLKATEEDLRKEIQLLGKKQKSSQKVSNEDSIVELKKQNEILKRKNDVIIQNFELERIELQTMLDQKEALVKSLNVKLNSKPTLNEPTSSNKTIELLRAENKQLKEKIYSLSPSNTNFTSALALDKFKSKSAKINLTIYRQFSKINSKMLTLNSKISLLQYRLKMKKKRNNDLINDQKLYYVRYPPQHPKKFAALV